MIIHDTDCLSLIDREKILEASILRQNLEKYSPDEIFTTIITFEENMLCLFAAIILIRNNLLS